MPYIPQKRRSLMSTPETPGELNFMITELLTMYIRNNSKSYSTLNDVIGVLECAKLELYRRVASPYEDEKMKLNGDVYHEIL